MSMAWFILLTVLVASSKACDPDACPRIPTQYYLELGCTPITDGTSCCPSSFNCSHLESRNSENCYLKHEMFEVNNEVPQEHIHSSCVASCYCVESGSFICAHYDCAEYFGSRRDNCIFQYHLDKCCSIGSVCEDDVSALATCELEGKTYKEGQRMFSVADKCKTCICAKGFTGKLEEPFCKQVSCGVEIFNPKKVKEGCIPIYIGPGACCAHTWRCPKTDDSVIPSIRTNPSALTCKFGELTMKKGDVLSPGEDSCVVCTCDVPPMPSCIKNAECQKEEN